MSKAVEKIDLIIALAKSACAASEAAEQCERESFDPAIAGDSMAVTYYETSQRIGCETYLGLKAAVAHVLAETPEAAMVQLCAARDMVEHLAELASEDQDATAIELRKSIDRLITSALLAFEASSQRKLEDFGLRRLRCRWVDSWLPPSEKLAAVRQNRSS